MSHASPRQFPAEHHVAELRRLMAMPAVAERMAQQPIRVMSYDVPSLAGYSVDGNTIYFDRHFFISDDRGKAVEAVGGDPYTLWTPLTIHEHVEKTLIDVLGYSYAAAHELATVAEHEELHKRGVSPATYEKALKPFIKRADTEKIEKPPPDLDCHPYYEDPDAQDLKILARLAELGVEDALEPQVKLEHEAVHYGVQPLVREGHLDVKRFGIGASPEFCKGCEHYDGHEQDSSASPRCYLVRSPIEPLGWCVMWQKRGKK